MEAVGSELNLFEPFINQTAEIWEMVQEFAPVASIIQGAPIDCRVASNLISQDHNREESFYSFCGAF